MEVVQQQHLEGYVFPNLILEDAEFFPTLFLIALQVDLVMRIPGAVLAKKLMLIADFLLCSIARSCLSVYLFVWIKLMGIKESVCRLFLNIIFEKSVSV